MRISTLLSHRPALFVCVLTFLMVVGCTQADPMPTSEPTSIPTATIPPTPTPAPTSTPTPAPTPSPTPLPTSTPSPEPTPTPDEEDIIWFDYEENPATITVEGSTIVFEGDIESSTYRDFLFAVRGKEDEITAIRINSPGGITDQGIQIGEWIFDHQLDVIVEDLCFSSCANYIFTAGKNKIIEKDAIVGWHGSEQQDPFLAAGYGISMAEHYARQFDEMKEWGETLPGESEEDFVATLLGMEAEEDGKEQRFLDAIGVNLYLLVYGMLPNQFDYYINEQTEFGGWTFAIEDMGKFGVNNVTYKGDGDYPSEKGLRNFPVAVFEISDDTVPPAVIPTPLPIPTPPPGSTRTPTPESEIESESYEWAEPPPAEITVEGDTVVIDGYLDHDAFIRFRSEIVGKEEEISSIRINSEFGEVDPAVFIGLWVYDNGVDVVVDELCMSACANYVFTAGQNKIIEDKALVAWFGSPHELEIEARSLGLSIDEVISRDMSDDERDEMLEEILQQVETGIELERQFLEWTGMNGDPLHYGFIGVDYDAGYWPMHLFEGWTFSIEDMAKLGIENVTYNGSGPYPDQLVSQQRDVTIFAVP